MKNSKKKPDGFISGGVEYTRRGDGGYNALDRKREKSVRLKKGVNPRAEETRRQVSASLQKGAKGSRDRVYDVQSAPQKMKGRSTGRLSIRKPKKY